MLVKGSRVRFLRGQREGHRAQRFRRPCNWASSYSAAPSPHRLPETEGVRHTLAPMGGPGKNIWRNWALMTGDAAPRGYHR